MDGVGVAQPVPHATQRRLTRAEYARIAGLGVFQGERVELIHGIVVRMPPIGPPHREVVDRLAEILIGALKGRVRVSIQQPFLAWDESEPEPDVAVVPARSYAAQHPDRAHLVIEVAETSLAYDRETKGPLYAASGVSEYWLVNLVDARVEVHTAPSNGAYTEVRIAGPGDTLTPRDLPDVTVSVAALFA